MNSILDFSRMTLSSVLNSKRIWAIHLAVNALLVVGFLYWTRIPEETAWQFALTVVSGLLIGFATLVLHSATFDYFHSSERIFWSSLRRCVSRVPAFLLWVLIFGFVLSMIGQIWDYQEQIGGWSRHILPLFLRHQITPRTMFAISHWLIWFVYFFLWPMLFLPVGAQVSVRGFRGFFSRTVFHPIARLSFWIAYAICFLFGAYIPYALAWMVPTEPSALNQQEWSMVVRLGSGYVLLVTAWVVLCAAITIACDCEGSAVQESSETKPSKMFPAEANPLSL